MTITALTNLPSTSDQANFVTKVDALFAKLATLKSEITAQIGAAHTALSAAPGFASPSTIAADTNAFFASLAVFVGEINVLYPGALTVLPTLPNPAAVTAAECDAFIAALATLVTEINVASAWDLSTGSYASKSLSVTAQENTPTSLAFSADGTKAYVVGLTNDTIYQYTLSTAWDVSTGSYASKSLSVTAQENAPYGLAFRADGTKAYVVGITNKTIYQYTLSTAWDISTGSYASKSLSVTAQDTAPAGLAFSADGTKAYVVGDTNNTIYQYNAEHGVGHQHRQLCQQEPVGVSSGNTPRRHSLQLERHQVICYGVRWSTNLPVHAEHGVGHQHRQLCQQEPVGVSSGGRPTGGRIQCERHPGVRGGAGQWHDLPV